MSVYTVHAPFAGDRPQLERVVLVRDGFHLSAAVFGPLWFLAQRLWLGLVGYLVIVGALAAALVLLRVDLEVELCVAVLVALLTGFEAASVKRWSCSRGRWRLLDVVVANGRTAAEHRFFERWNATRAGGAVPTVDRGAPPPVRLSAGDAAGFGEVMGLFPQPRAPR